MKNLTWQNPEQLFVVQVLINKVKSKCCGIKGYILLTISKLLTFLLIITCIHYISNFIIEKQEASRIYQNFRSFKSNIDVFNTKIHQMEKYDISLLDSSIIFGNPSAKMRVTVVSNPHCNPCAKMHERVKKIIGKNYSDICIQYIFTSFSNDLEESSKFLIAVYQQKTSAEIAYIYDIVLPIFRQGLTSINSEQERGGSRLGLTLFRPCT